MLFDTPLLERKEILQSLIYQGKRTKDWIKFKRMADKDFIICGYEYSSGPGKMASLILGEYQDGELVYAGCT